jgi:uncharacterized membrane protein
MEDFPQKVTNFSSLFSCLDWILCMMASPKLWKFLKKRKSLMKSRKMILNGYFWGYSLLLAQGTV